MQSKPSGGGSKAFWRVYRQVRARNCDLDRHAVMSMARSEYGAAQKACHPATNDEWSTDEESTEENEEMETCKISRRFSILYYCVFFGKILKMKRINHRSSSQARKGNEINILPIKEEIFTILYSEEFVVKNPRKLQNCNICHKFKVGNTKLNISNV